MKSIPKTFPLWSLLLLLGCEQPSSESADGLETVEVEKPETPPKPAEKFNGSFGESFLHSGLLTIHHNPHGGAATVGFSYDGNPLGALNVRPNPPKGSEGEFAQSGIDFLKRRYGIDEVAHNKPKNSKGYAFHRFDATITDISNLPFSDNIQADPKGYRVIMAIFIDTRTTGTVGQKTLREMYGSYQFEFFIPNSKASDLAPEIETIIHTFDLPESTTLEDGEEKSED